MNIFLDSSKLPSEFIDSKYIDSESEELIKYFWIDRVNIFVGANNAGKSRFMRGLIKKSSFLASNSSIIENLFKNLIEKLEVLGKDNSLGSGLKFQVNNVNNENLQDFISESHKRLFKQKFNSPTEIGSTFFSLLKSDLLNIKLKEDNESKVEELKNFLSFKADLIETAINTYKFTGLRQYPNFGLSTIVCEDQYVLHTFKYKFEEILNLINEILEGEFHFLNPPKKNLHTYPKNG